MALIKSVPDPTGTGNLDAYYRLSGIYIEPIRRTIRVVLDGYHDRASRDAGRPAIDELQTSYTISGAAFDDFVVAQSRAAVSDAALAYGIAKAQPALAGATDA